MLVQIRLMQLCEYNATISEDLDCKEKCIPKEYGNAKIDAALSVASHMTFFSNLFN